MYEVNAIVNVCAGGGNSTSQREGGLVFEGWANAPREARAGIAANTSLDSRFSTTHNF